MTISLTGEEVEDLRVGPKQYDPWPTTELKFVDVGRRGMERHR